MKWIVRWSEIVDATVYIVRPVNIREDKTYYLSNPVTVYSGWGVKQLREGCYAALECPAFDPTELLKKESSS